MRVRAQAPNRGLEGARKREQCSRIWLLFNATR
nr:MAG TPA: hypothetical protein [Caudoviricetes sp.]